MSICPFAVWEPIPENETQGHIVPTTAVLHTNGSAAKDLHDYFARKDIVVESHFQVLFDGTLLQYIDTGVMADANYHANGFAISIETAAQSSTSIGLTRVASRAERFLTGPLT